MKIVINNYETWLVCGGRDFADQCMFDNAMSQIMGMFGCPEKIVHGAATGADTMADEWSRRMAIVAVKMPADWNRYGIAAGPIRNEEMLARHKPRRVIAFPGGKGTADMIQRAKNHRSGGTNLDVIEIAPTHTSPEQAP